jgi:hypothetical protein
MSDESNKEICPICCEELDGTISTLLCGHKFHIKCIYTSYIVETHNTNSNIPQKKCPYCRQHGGFLELEPNTIPVKWIHKEYPDFIKASKNRDVEKLKLYMNPIKCFSILKTGINKGNQCNNKHIKETYFCKKHN